MGYRKNKRFIPSASAAALSLLCVSTTDATGIRILEQSATTIANVNAGSTALAEDATTAYTNPAGLTQLTGSGMAFNTAVIDLNIELEDLGSVGPLGTPANGNTGGNAGTSAAVPSFFYYREIDDNLTAGISITSPYGLATDYEEGWEGRYQTLKAEAMSLEINPVVAYQVTENFSVGGGISFYYLDASFGQAVDFGSACYGLGPLSAGCAPSGILPGNSDGHVETELNGWGYGYNLGLFYKPSSWTQLGFSYRSKVDFDLEGDVTFRNPDLGPYDLITQNVETQNTDADAKITLPEVISVSFVQNINDKWRVLGDVTYSAWDRFEDLTVRRENDASDIRLDFGWKENTRWSLALNYQFSPKLLFRMGYGETKPVAPNMKQKALFPNGTKKTVGLGLRYISSDRYTFDLAYSYLNDESIEVHETGLAGNVLNAKSDANSHVLALQVSINF